MSRPVKIVLYIVCITVAVVFGLKAKGQFRNAAAAKQARQQTLEDAASTENTNILAESTNLLAENTNAVAAVAPDTESVATVADTNAAATNLNAVPASTNPVAASTRVARAPSVSYSRLISYVLLCGLGFVGLAFLLARDIAYFFAHKAEQAMFNDEGAPADPEYEQAEELWKDGKHLDAIQAMREYLQKHPREQYVALRIAEIYEKNLSNPLAAALEYEEVLKKNLPAERWGWAAIHLANLYSGPLNKPDSAIALLHRIDAEYGRTSAANKARERLTQIDPTFVPAATAAVPVVEEESEAKPASNLPPGFRPKTKA
jgi:TolA-binding protein